MWKETQQTIQYLFREINDLHGNDFFITRGEKKSNLLCWFPFLHTLSDKIAGRHRTFSNESWQVQGKLL